LQAAPVIGCLLLLQNEDLQKAAYEHPAEKKKDMHVYAYIAYYDKRIV
jgi:hypothetical protein